MGKHIIKVGEVLSTIAKDNNVSLQTLLDANSGAPWLPRGVALKDIQNTLPEGKELIIPDRAQKNLARGTTQTHDFVKPRKPKHLHIILQNPDATPTKGWNYEITINGKKVAEGKTGSDGLIETKDIPLPASSSVLSVEDTAVFGAYTFPPELIQLHIGDLTSIVDKTEVSRRAVQKMLLDLGYYQDNLDGDFKEHTRAALREFQADEGLPPHGYADEATCQALVKAVGNPTSAAKGLESPAESGRDTPLESGEDMNKKKNRQSEQVTTRSEYLDPTASDQTNRQTLGRFHFFPHDAYVAPCDAGEEDKNTNVIRMPARNFLFLDTGHWEEDSRTFGLIWGRHAYLCDYLPEGKGGDSGGRPGLDTDFLNAMAGSVKVRSRASASWASGDDFDWTKLLVVIPDIHLMTDETGAIWKPSPPKSKNYDLQAELDLLAFTQKLTEASSLAGKVTVVQIGDSYDLWVNCEPCYFEANEDRKMVLVKDPAAVPTLKKWIREIQGLPYEVEKHAPSRYLWVLFALLARVDAKMADDLKTKMDEWDAKKNEAPDDILHEDDIQSERDRLQKEVNQLLSDAKAKIKDNIGEKAFSAILIQDHSKEAWLNPAEAALRLLEKTYTQNKGMIYVYGNHDNYLIDSKLCGEAKISPRRRYYDGAKGVFVEHGHRLEATFLLGHPWPANYYNFDGTRSGYNATVAAYQNLKKGQTWWGNQKKKAAGKWAQWVDQPQYWGEFAQVWLGRQSRNNPHVLPPHIFVIGHTHKPLLLEININAWRVGGDEPSPEEIVPMLQMHLDADRDGKVDDDVRNLDVWEWGKDKRGAIILCNNDDDDGKKDLDNSNTHIDGDKDLSDIAPLVLRRNITDPFPGGTTATLEVSDEKKIRIFAKREGGAEEVIGPKKGKKYQIPDLGPQEMEFGMEALRYPDKNFSGEIELILTVDTPDGMAEQRAKVRVAPWIAFNHRHLTQKVYVVATADNQDFRANLSTAVTGAGVSAPREADGSTYGGDRWMQDVMEVGFSSLPGKHLPVVLRTANDRGSMNWGTLDTFPKKELLGPEFGWVQALNPTVGTSRDSFGNLECSPPVVVNGRWYRFGRIVYGGGSGSTNNMQPEVIAFLNAQQIQNPFMVDTSWLVVGHVDEFLSFVPDKSQKGFKLLLASPREAWEILKQNQGPLFGNKPLPPGYENFRSVESIVADSELRETNDMAQEQIDKNKAILMRELALEESNIGYVPVVFRWTTRGDPHSGMIAFTPGMVNMLVLTTAKGVHLCIPDPFGPVGQKNKDVFKDYMEQMLSPIGCTWTFIDDFETYHNLFGEIHCGTNSLRKPPTDRWWWEQNVIGHGASPTASSGGKASPTPPQPPSEPAKQDPPPGGEPGKSPGFAGGGGQSGGGGASGSW